MMKKILLSALLTLSLNGLFSQTVTDSVTMGAGSPSYPYDVYYNLTTQQKDTFLNTNWHLAFALRPAVPPTQTMQSTTIRINESRSVVLYKTGKTVADWSTTVDTAGMSTWTSMHNDNRSWDIGAFNADHDTANMFDYGWGQYDMPSHNVLGDRLYVLSVGTGPARVFKKIHIEGIIFDSLWKFTIANIDGTDSVSEMIVKPGHGQQLFMYYNVNTKTQVLREPNHPWDLVFTYYRDYAVFPPYPGAYYNFMGVMQAPQISTSRVQGIPTLAADTSNATSFSKHMNTIGYDWKMTYFGPPASPWGITDSLSYFIQRDGDSAIYKLWFTAFASNPNNVVFNTVRYDLPVTHTGLQAVTASNGNLILYPNPASTTVNVVLSESKATRADVLIYDLTGKVVLHSTLDATLNTSLNVSGLQKGIYFISVNTASETAVRKLIIE